LAILPRKKQPIRASEISNKAQQKMRSRAVRLEDFSAEDRSGESESASQGNQDDGRDGKLGH
jgi:hypothetical protein